MIYLPEILPLPGVTIAVLMKSIGKAIGGSVLAFGKFSGLIMLFIIAIVRLDERCSLEFSFVSL
jgi:hypothetical protein